MGPLVSKDHYDKVMYYIDSGVKEGATLLLDGRKYDANFIGPTVFTDVTPNMKIYPRRDLRARRRHAEMER